MRSSRRPKRGACRRGSAWWWARGKARPDPPPSVRCSRKPTRACTRTRTGAAAGRRAAPRSRRVHARRRPDSSYILRMTLSEYTALDARGLADAIARRQLSAKEAALAAARAIDAINPRLNAVGEAWADGMGGRNARTLGDGPFRGVPFLIRAVFEEEAGRRIEWGSRLCRG